MESGHVARHSAPLHLPPLNAVSSLFFSFFLLFPCVVDKMKGLGTGKKEVLFGCPSKRMKSAGVLCERGGGGFGNVEISN